MGGRRLPLRCGPWLALAGLMASAACDTPTVDARAVWLDEEHVGDARTLHVYSRGVLETSTVRAAGAGGATDQALLLELAPGGGGALVMLSDPAPLLAAGASSLRAAYLDFEGRRALPFAVALGLRAPTPFFSRRGDALAWVDACAGELDVLALAPGYAHIVADAEGERRLEHARVPLGAKDPRCLPRWGAASASAAPVIFALAGIDDGNVVVAEPGAEIIALRYAGEGGAAATKIEELGRGYLDPAIVNGRPVGCGSSVGCLGLVDPDGASLSVVGGRDEPCRIQRWSWVPEVGEDGALAIPPATCVWKGSGDVLAAISPRHYVIGRDQRLLRLDWTTGEEVGLPVVGDGLLGAGDFTWSLSRDGRAVSAVSGTGFMVRVDAARVEVINIVQVLCAGEQAPVFSASGRWAAWTCAIVNDGLDGGEADVPGGDNSEVQGESSPLGTVVRASVGGLERFDGVPMWPVAIDDSGELLLYSRSDGALNDDFGQPAGSPRNLYVLGSDGELSRVDAMEPDPEQSADLEGDLRWIAGAPL
ncbi:MAG: hypothetical protein R3A79_04695 [Nannocystaceae bacterium]